MNIPGFTLLGFKRPREVVCQTLGKLERQVMEAIWQRGGEVSVREIVRAFDEQFAYTTLMTTLDRLHKKGLLSRRKDGRAFLYCPRFSREEMEQGVARDVIEGLLGSDAVSVEPMLACIVDAVSEHDRELLDELDRLVKEKRRELRRQD
ncbi:MAG TPA: BlaI/MecI/CopY family transcriptional regulator [Pyrinomonadaceae bacterium]|jgi:predicted transcriptional regulator